MRRVVFAIQTYNVASLIPICRQKSATAVPPSACLGAKANCPSVNRERFIVRPAGRPVEDFEHRFPQNRRDAKWAQLHIWLQDVPLSGGATKRLRHLPREPKLLI
jgi:hypothetical protein